MGSGPQFIVIVIVIVIVIDIKFRADGKILSGQKVKIEITESQDSSIKCIIVKSKKHRC